VVLGACGTPFRFGGGSVAKGVLLTAGALMKYCGCGVTVNCVAFLAFGPGVPSSLMMPVKSRLWMVCPSRGRNVPNA
jgi:hypothetical protein